MSNYTWSEAFERLPIGATLRRKSDGRVMRKVDYHYVLPSGDHQTTLFKYIIGPLQALDELFDVLAEGNASPPGEARTRDNSHGHSREAGPAIAERPIN
jgi:hypothetical protein